VHEMVNPTVVTEHYEKPVTHSTEVKNPIIESQTLKTQVHTEEKNLTEIEKQKLGEGALIHEPEKKSLGTKIKEMFTGNPEE